jgi:hypothetical protein
MATNANNNIERRVVTPQAAPNKIPKIKDFIGAPLVIVISFAENRYPAV